MVAGRKPLSNALSENAQVSTAFQAWSFQTPTDTLPAQFREEEVQPRVGEREWTTLSTSDAPLPFAPPAWDIPPPPEAAPVEELPKGRRTYLKPAPNNI